METAFYIALAAVIVLAITLYRVRRNSRRRLARICELEAACFFYREQRAQLEGEKLIRSQQGEFDKRHEEAKKETLRTSLLMVRPHDQ